MKILVTGGAGFIGSHTTDALVAAGHSVAVLDNLSAGKRAQVNAAARFHQVDLREADRVKEVIGKEKPEVIVHLAAQMDVRRSVADPVYDAQVNVVGMLNLMEAARVNGLRRVVFSSTGGAIYGNQEHYPCAEDHRTEPISPYGVAKLATERYLFFYQAEYGIDYCAVRYANVYGPRQDPHGEAGVVAIFCGRMLEGKPVTIFGNGEQTRDYVFVGDVVRANVAAVEAAVTGPVNIGTGRETSVNQLFKELAGSSYELKPTYAPGRPGEQQRSVINPARAAKELNWQPQVALADGLSRTLEFFKQRAGRAT